MQVSLKPGTELRSRIGKMIGRVAAAVLFAFVIGSFAVGPARAGNDHNDRGRDRGADQHRDNDNRGNRGGYAYREPDYNYYAPQPNYYSAPDPYYYGPGPGYDAPPQGISLFFGL